jgi:hypothetical protein
MLLDSRGGSQFGAALPFAASMIVVLSFEGRQAVGRGHVSSVLQQKMPCICVCSGVVAAEPTVCVDIVCVAVCW